MNFKNLLRTIRAPFMAPLSQAMSGSTSTLKTTTAALALTAFAALGFQAVRQATRPRTMPTTLATIVPQGALLTIESPNFAALLKSWNQSPQQTAWLASDNYSVFSNSRLLGRLDDARTQFESAIPSRKQDPPGIDSTFLTQIAGRQSIFAWYDVGNLEFLYITRMPAAQAARIALLQSHAGWTPRQSAGATFYLRHSSAADGPSRTVAYAQLPTPAGDTLLLLSTREDLLAQSLALIQTPGAAVSTEPWYTDALAANAPPPQTPLSSPTTLSSPSATTLSSRSAAEGSASPTPAPSPTPTPALRMILNLDRLVPLPAFRTYWVQQNITQMKQYRSAVSDLYLSSNQFREERTVLLKSAALEPANRALSSLVLAVPSNGVYRATATHSPDLAITALEEKLLGRATLDKLPAQDAPDPALSASQSGDSADLETRIDTPAPISATFSNQALADTLKSAAFDAILTYSSAGQPTAPEALWIPIHNAVLLHAANPWNPQTLQSALQQSLRGALTTSTLGIDFRETAPGIYTLDGPKRLYLATRANLAILTDDLNLLTSALASTPANPTTSPATVLAGFSHTTQRAPYARLTSLIDGNNQPPAAGETSDAAPPFFSRNLKSLSDSFSALDNEQFLERSLDTPSGPALHQTVLYNWRPQ